MHRARRAQSFLSGAAYRVGKIVDIGELFSGADNVGHSTSFFRDRGLRCCCVQEESTLNMCVDAIQETLCQAKIAASDVGAVIVDMDQWHCTPEDEAQVLEAILTARISHVQVTGIGMQTCSGCITAIDYADRLLRTDEQLHHVLVLLGGRAKSGMSRIDSRRETILSDGVASCIVSAARGDFALCATSSYTALTMVRSALAERSALHSLVSSYRELSGLVGGLCAAVNISQSEIQALLGTNGSQVYGTFAARAAGMEEARVFTQNVAEYGHVFSCDQLINLATFSGFREGSYYLLMGWSPYVFNGALLSYVGMH